MSVSRQSISSFQNGSHRAHAGKGAWRWLPAASIPMPLAGRCCPDGKCEHEHELISYARGSEVRRQQNVQRALVVRLEGSSSKTISVMMEKKNPRMSQPSWLG